VKHWQVTFDLDGKHHYKIITGKTVAQVRHKIRMMHPLALNIFINYERVV
jgi:hypothetical protein